MHRNNPIDTGTGWRHFWGAAKNSLAGFRCMMTESAFRQELTGFAVLLCLFFFVGAQALEYLIAAILFLILIGVEALNTAVELIVDRSSPEISDFGRDTKDIGSFATFCLLAANGLFALWVIVGSLI